MINKNFLNKIPKTAKNKIFDYFKNEANKEHLLKIFKEDVYERFKTHKDKKDKKEKIEIKEISEEKQQKERINQLIEADKEERKIRFKYNK